MISRARTYYYCLCLLITFIACCIDQVSSKEGSKNVENKCDILLKKVLDPIPDKETEERVRKLLVSYIEDVKKTYQQVREESQSPGTKRVYEEFKRGYNEFVDQLEKNVQKIIESNELINAIYQESDAIIRSTFKKTTNAITEETYHLYRKLRGELPEQYWELKRKYFTPINNAVMDCNRDIIDELLVKI